MSAPTIGFVGLGAMGGAVARRLAGAFRVQAYDLDPAAVTRAVDAGAVPAATVAEALTGAQVVVTSLPTPEIVESFWAEHAVALGEGTTVVDTSTIDPGTSRRVSDLLASTRSGTAFVACTLGKTPVQAEAGQVPAFVGGPAQAVAALAPVLDRMAGSVHDMGSVEGATSFKLISNLVGMTNLVALTEGYLLARSAGIDPEVFTEALRTTGGWSVQADIRLPWIVADDLDPRFAVDLAAKDLRLSVDAAARRAVPTPVGAAALGVLTAASAGGHGARDAAAVVEALDPRRTARD